MTFIVGGAQAYIGYVPTDEAFAEGGYETGPGRWSRVLPGSETILRTSCMELIAQAADGELNPGAPAIGAAPAKEMR